MGNMTVLNITEEAITLGEEYMSKGAIPTSEPEDAYHIAIATINGIEALASWNFKHIVSINPIRKIHEINLMRNYQIIEIGSLELFEQWQKPSGGNRGQVLQSNNSPAVAKL